MDIREKDISVSLFTSDFRGDHEADVIRACALKEGETVRELVNRLFIELCTSPDICTTQEASVFSDTPCRCKLEARKRMRRGDHIQIRVTV